MCELTKTIRFERFCDRLLLHLRQLYDYTTYPGMSQIYGHIYDSCRYAEFCEYDFASHTMSYDSPTTNFGR